MKDFVERSFLSEIGRFLDSDEGLRRLHAAVVDYARIYALAKQRPPGCDGMGEFVTLREEFKDAVDALIRYCKGRNYSVFSRDFDLDAMVRELLKS
jgi:hypothetical protein